MSSANNKSQKSKFDHVYIVMRYDSYVSDPMQAIGHL